MERFRIRADFIFEAEDITDAFMQLTDHFAKRAVKQKSQLDVIDGGMQITKIVPNLVSKKITDEILNREEGY